MLLYRPNRRDKDFELIDALHECEALLGLLRLVLDGDEGRAPRCMSPVEIKIFGGEDIDSIRVEKEF